MASEQLRKGCSREGCAPPANRAKGALPPVASGSEIFEPQKKICQVSEGRNCHAGCGSPFKAKQTKAMEPPTSRPGQSGPFDTCVSVAWSSVGAQAAWLSGCWGWRVHCLVCRKAQSTPGVTGPEHRALLMPIPQECWKPSSMRLSGEPEAASDSDNTCHCHCCPCQRSKKGGLWV